MATTKILTDKEKIDKFIKWMKDEKNNARCDGSGSAWNWVYFDAMERVYSKARRTFIEPKEPKVKK